VAATAVTTWTGLQVMKSLQPTFVANEEAGRRRRFCGAKRSAYSADSTGSAEVNSVNGSSSPASEQAGALVAPRASVRADRQRARLVQGRRHL
jgi:hypothetical protein